MFFQFWWISEIFVRTASLDLKIIFGFLLLAITLTTFYRLEPHFLDHLCHEHFLDSILYFLMKNKFASEIALHEIRKIHDNCRFFMNTLRRLSDLLTSVWSFLVIAVILRSQIEPFWNEILTSWCKCVFKKLHLLESFPISEINVPEFPRNEHSVIIFRHGVTAKR